MPSLIEPLERRELLAIVNVASFGAVPNDGQNDTAAINAAITAAQPGDTIQFNAGRYDVGELLLRSNRTYKGVSGSIISSSGSEFGERIEANGSNVLVTRLRFEGAGVFMGNGGTYRNLTF